ncbi:MAG: hypothetical protein AAFS11_03735, partial [Planctomycetota bacterium]
DALLEHLAAYTSTLFYDPHWIDTLTEKQLSNLASLSAQGAALFNQDPQRLDMTVPDFGLCHTCTELEVNC